MTQLSQPLKWHGGKHYLAAWIIGHMPQHIHYVEPYAGALVVLLRKPYEGVSEVVNDLDGDLTAFWRVLQGPNSFHAFVRRVEAIPFSQVEFDDAAIGHPTDPVDQAVRFFIRVRQSRQGLRKDFATMSRTRTRRGMNEQVSAWLTAVEGLPEIHLRLRRVAILNDEATRVIRQQDGPDTLFYCDPPYLHETRVTTSDYAHEMTEDDHVRLLDTLAGLKGKFLLSSYRSDLYDRCAARCGWLRRDRQIDCKASSRATKGTRTESLWMNYDPGTGA